MVNQITYNVKIQLLYKILFIIYFLACHFIESFEIVLVLTLGMSLILFVNSKFSRITIDLLLLLSLILMTAVFSAFFYKMIPYDFVKGVSYFIKPILMITIGYVFCKKIKDLEFFFKFIFYVSIISALIHIFIVVKYFYLQGISINFLRYIGGKSNLIEFFGLLFLWSRKKLNLTFINKSIAKIGYVILLISFVFYFSRTQFVGLLIFVLAINGYIELKPKAIIIITFVLVSVLLFFTYLNSTTLERESKGINGFLYKIKMAPSEIFSNEIDVNNHAELWDKWRSYEAKMAFEQVEEKGTFAMIFGKGIGGLVDLKIDFHIEGIDEKQISIIHNGFVLVYFKAGLIGLTLYILMIFRLYLKVYSNKFRKGFAYTINNFLGGFGLYLLFTSLIISGIYNVSSILPLILGYFLGIDYLNNVNKNEDRDYRN